MESSTRKICANKEVEHHLMYTLLNKMIHSPFYQWLKTNLFDNIFLFIDEMAISCYVKNKLKWMILNILFLRMKRVPRILVVYNKIACFPGHLSGQWKKFLVGIMNSSSIYFKSINRSIAILGFTAALGLCQHNSFQMS